MKSGLPLNTISRDDGMSRMPHLASVGKLPPCVEQDSPLAELSFSKHRWFKVLQLLLFTVVRYSNSGVPHLRDPGA